MKRMRAAGDHRIRSNQLPLDRLCPYLWRGDFPTKETPLPDAINPENPPILKPREIERA